MIDSYSYKGLFEEAVQYSYDLRGGAMSPEVFIEYILTHQAELGLKYTADELYGVLDEPVGFLYDDVKPFCDDLRKHSQISPIIWTQGEHNHHVVGREGYQNRKIVKSGILELMPDDWDDRLAPLDLPKVIGDYAKTSQGEIAKIGYAMQRAKMQNLIVIDDRPDNLCAVQKHMILFGIETYCYCIDRFSIHDKLPDGILSIRSLDQVYFKSMPRCLAIIDYDNTLNDTNRTKAAVYDRLLTLNR